MSALFSSLKTIAGNYGQGIMTIQAQLEDMKFGLLPTALGEAAIPKTFTTSISSSSSQLSSQPSSCKNSCPSNFCNNNNHINRDNNTTNINNNMSITTSTTVESMSTITSSTSSAPTLNSASDFNQWLHAMKMVARLPGGTPPEFRRKLWLALSDRHLHTSGIDWNKEQAKCLSEAAWLDDDEELGIQIVKDLHRTGSSLFSGPNGNINQAKLKSVLLGYARWNPEVGYCQGFNMLGALILQVMDKSEIEALKVMIYLIEGVLPSGYFSGSLSGLQADMAVFNEILSTRLPKLSKHLQRLQGHVGEGSLEPPLINVFTMQWFLTLFCTCLPTSCVLRVWDLVLIEGSDILLRTALAIWGLLAERIIKTKTADEFYCKMGTLSGELLNGHLFDSNGLIQRIVDLGPIADLQKMREKHLFNITPWKDRRGLKIFYSDDDGDSDDETWKFMAGARRASMGLSAAAIAAANRNQLPLNDARDRIALDISLLKKQYAKLRERQRQAHIILTNTAKQTVIPTANSNVNQYLKGRNAIVSNKGRRIGPPVGSIPPARVTPPVSIPSKQQQKRLRNATIDGSCASVMMRRNDDNCNIHKSPSATSSISSVSSSSDIAASTSKSFTRKRSESSSYSEDSDGNEEINFDDDDNSSTSTSLCDEDLGNEISSIEASPLKTRHGSSASNSIGQSDESRCSSSNATSNQRISVASNSTATADTKRSFDSEMDISETIRKSFDECDTLPRVEENVSETSSKESLSATSNLNLDLLSVKQTITSTSQLSPIADIAAFLGMSAISPLKTPASCLLDSYPLCDLTEPEREESESSTDAIDSKFEVSEEGVTNAYFERINGSSSSERPTNVPISLSSTKLSSMKISNSDASDISTATLRQSPDKPCLPTIPACTEIIRIAPDQSPLIHRNINDIMPIDRNMLADDTNRNTDRVLRIIEENSKILDRIMSKNSKRTFDAPLETENKSEIGSVQALCEVNSSDIVDDSNAKKDQSNGNKNEMNEKKADNFMKIYLEKNDEFTEGNISENAENEEKTISLPSETPPTNDTLISVRNTVRSVDDIIKEALEKSASQSPSKKTLPTNVEIEDDLQTLLKMSAELLREEMPINLSPIEMEKMELISSTSIDSEMYNSEMVQEKRIIDLESNTPPDVIVDATTGDISATISSIKNTIKSIDDLCQDDDRRTRERTDKTLNDIWTAVEKLEDGIKTKKSHESPEAPIIIEHSTDDTGALSLTHDSIRPMKEDDDDKPLSPRLLSSRMSRDRSRITSPRRRKDDDFGEYESRARRSKSPSMATGDLSKKFNFNENSPRTSPYKTNEKLEIRHTCVTATFYDRFLSQKLEQQQKMDRSPSSPIITKAYLDSLKPTSFSQTTSIYNENDISSGRLIGSKSTECSPSRPKMDVSRSPSDEIHKPKSSFLLMPQLPYNTIERNSLTTLSCDNIPSHFKTTALQKKIDPDSESNFERYASTNSTTNTMMTTSLAIKVKKPSELGIKLGMYKPQL